MIFEEMTPLSRLMMVGFMAKPKAVQDTATGNPLTFLTDLAKPLKSLLIPFTPIQEGSGDPSPVNERPIVPWDGLTVKHGGKNLLNPAYFAESSEFYSVDNGIITAKKSDYRSWGSLPKMFLRAGTYTISKSTADGVMVVRSSINDYSSSVVYAEGVASGKFTLSVDAYIAIKPSENMSYPATFTLQLEAGQTVTAYEPYVPITETDISFPSPVYGGTLDVVSGVLTVEYAKIALNGTEENWSNYNQGTSFSVPIIGMTRDIYKTVLCDRFAQIKNITSFGVYASASNDYAYFINATDIEGVTDLASWKAYLAENPLTIAYKLAEPQEITLTPAQITALVGNNTIWSDADGQMTAVYFKKKG